MDSERLKQLWERFVGGDQSAFGKIYETCRPVLIFYCLGKFKNLELAENCSSEALLKTLDHPRPEEIEDIERWLFTVARNLCVSQLRMDSRRAKILDGISKNLPGNYQPEVYENLDAENIKRIIIEELAIEEQEIWQLHSDGFSNSEISKKLTMNEKTVANKKSGIRTRLMEKVKKYLKSQEV